ncbi:HNH endonuclease [Brevibacillus porteri]|uniref:HNH endonuclease n=1 Tax=Brevibacillus porteri TaxID=2126350 RepID=UPI00362FF1A0
MLNKACTKCKAAYPATEEYFYKDKNRKDGLNSWCRDCFKENSRKYAVDNKEEYMAYKKQWYKKNKERLKEKQKIIDRNLGDFKRQYASKWRKNNKNKIKTYNEKRRSQRKHNITQKEWIACKTFFQFECAYCGLSEDDHKNKYRNQGLHKEHVIFNGRNDLKNCIPSCHSCNSSKRTESLNNWYNKKNDIYNRDRYFKIYVWLSNGYKEHITQKKVINPI